MKSRLSLSHLIDKFTGIAIVVLLAVIAERDEPGGHQHYTLLVTPRVADADLRGKRLHRRVFHPHQNIRRAGQPRQEGSPP